MFWNYVLCVAKTKWTICSNFYGLLEISELYRNLLKFMFSKKATKIWHLLHNVKLTVNILSNVVAFLENIKFKNSTFLLYFIFSVGIKHTIFFFCLGRCVYAKIFLKVSLSQNDFLVSLIFQKTYAKFWWISALESKKWSNQTDKGTLLC